MIGHKVPHAIIGAMYWVRLTDIHAHPVRKHFTIEKHGRDFVTKEPTYEQIPIYREGAGEFQGYLGLPLAEGMRLFPCDDPEERLSDGRPFRQGEHWHRLPDPNHPLAAPGQAEFMDLTMQAVEDNYAALVKADTGTGKTAVALNTAARLGRSTLVLVPLDRLRKQWIDAAVQHLGMKREDIGEIVGPKCQWGRPLVIGMMKSIAMKDYPPECYSAFGLVITDEVHNTGAQLASRTQGRFNSAHRLALTATDERKDDGDRVYYSTYGRPAFARSMPALPTDVIGVSYTAKKPVSGKGKAGKLISLAYDFDRNRVITDFAVHWYRNGRYPLFLCDHVRHAEILFKMFQAGGIPDDVIGLYTGEQPNEAGGREKSSKEYLDWCEKRASVVIATYGMMKEGIDMPRLDRGMDVSPREDIVQALGRIRRIYPDKKRALWVTLRDRADKQFEGLYFARTNKLRNLSNVTVHRCTVEEALAFG